MIWIRSIAFALVVVGAAAWLHRYLSPGIAFGLMAIAFVGLTLYHASFLSRLTAWAGLPRNRPLPIGWGVWTPLIERLNRFMRQQQSTLGEIGSELE
ncbi:MAG: phosphate regulon sensor protein PhoR, partial [Betaproteobacteria bacterium]